jgi:hypothetical protein
LVSATSQIGFIDFICAPVYAALSTQFAALAPLADGTQENRIAWEALQKEDYVMRQSESSSSIRPKELPTTTIATTVAEPIPTQSRPKPNASKTCIVL